MRKQILINGDMSQATLATTGIEFIQQCSWSIQAVWTGAPVGSFIIQISNDVCAVEPGDNPSANVVNWTTYTNSTVAVSGAGDFLWNSPPNAGYRWVRLFYTKSSGTGSVTATFNGKQNY